MAWYTRQTPETNRIAADQRLARIKDPANREAFTLYINKRRAAALVKSGTHVADADEFVRFGKWLGKRSLRKLVPGDIISFFGTQTAKMPSTRYKSYVVLKRFFRELHGLDDNEVPPEFKGFKMKRPPKTTVRIEELITADEFRRMLRFCRNNMERALIAILYEVGTRASELLSVDIMHVTEDQYGYLLTIPDVDGNKTGGRRIRIHLAAIHLREWLAEHKFADNLQAPVFYSRSNRARNKRLGYQTLLKLVHRLRKEAGVTKHIWPHLYRHTAATENVKRGLVGPPLSKQMGWVVGTDQEAVYVHLSEGDGDDLVLASLGVKDVKTTEHSALLPLVCPACKTPNASDKLYCIRPGCFTPLTDGAKAVVEARQEQMLQEMLAKRLRSMEEASSSLAVK